MKIVTKACIVLLAVVLTTGSSLGCRSLSTVPTDQSPVTIDESAGAFSVISHATTTKFGRQVWCIYVEAFRDDPSIWSGIRRYGLDLANQLNAGNGQNAVAFYFFDVLNGVSSPAVVDNFWSVPGEDPHCVASIDVDTAGRVVAWKYPFVDSKASPL
jgi:hypothetical protein